MGHVYHIFFVFDLYFKNRDGKNLEAILHFDRLQLTPFPLGAKLTYLLAFSSLDA